MGIDWARRPLVPEIRRENVLQPSEDFSVDRGCEPFGGIQFAEDKKLTLITPD